ncbi:uncharacterized protein (DUF1015 family) [Methanofollis sp. W23]|uniref:DUF1015 domain-containing protein n=1 Tax=Methanofollis sp. W23 TaxID=2817849 RepID=UPI001AE3FF74|nr:DUF1015 family protein [Methanofollis sp. W23]MBP2146942.1 uncharacterized protein (DUF1015 family) [Methanofollis sp. W23]
MVKIYRFSGLRPARAQAAATASVPYDVVTTDEAEEILKKNPKSFLRVVRTDALLRDIPADDEKIYETARENLQEMEDQGILCRDEKPSMYLYRVKQGGNLYLGLVACVDVDDYLEDTIKKHEHTRYDKERDRTRHIAATNANTGLVVMLYPDEGEIFGYLDSILPDGKPDAVVKTENGVVHELFKVSDPVSLSYLEDAFTRVPALYIADGHHRARSAVTVAEERRKAGTYEPEDGRIMTILFAHKRVKIHGYSRLVTDLGKYTPESFLAALKEKFEVRPYGEIDDTVFKIAPLREVEGAHVVHMYLGGEWYEISSPIENPEDLTGSLDVSALQKEALEGMLGVTDPRADPRLQYLGGARPLADLEARVDSGEFALAFSMQPVDVETVMEIADAGMVMPPKSTWFEPKLLSGLVIHTLGEGKKE